MAQGLTETAAGGSRACVRTTEKSRPAACGHNEGLRGRASAISPFLAASCPSHTSRPGHEPSESRERGRNMGTKHQQAWRRLAGLLGPLPRPGPRPHGRRRCLPFSPVSAFLSGRAAQRRGVPGVPVFPGWRVLEREVGAGLVTGAALGPVCFPALLPWVASSGSPHGASQMEPATPALAASHWKHTALSDRRLALRGRWDVPPLITCQLPTETKPPQPPAGRKDVTQAPPQHSSAGRRAPCRRGPLHQRHRRAHSHTQTEAGRN